MQQKPDPTGSADALSILLVDDDPDVLFATARMLRTAGYTVQEVDCGEACLRAASVDQPELVLLDVVLPDLGGDEVCRRLKADPTTASTHVILMSHERTDSDEQSHGLEQGADGYIARPVAKRELLARVSSLARIIRAEQERDRVIKELRKALAEIKTLRGLLPLCANCKSVRKDDGYWSRIDVYLSENMDVDITHGICPDCERKLYPEYAEDE